MDPREICLIHLREWLDDPLTPAEVALVLGNDARLIEEFIANDREQEALWSESALEERGDPDADLETVEVNLGEARTAAMDAQIKAEALDYLRAHPQPAAGFALADELAAVQQAEREWLAVHGECNLHWQRTAECPTHGPAIIAGRERQAAAVALMRERVRELAPTV